MPASSRIPPSRRSQARRPIASHVRPTLEFLEDRVTPSTLYIDQPGDFAITNDQGAPGLDAGDTVTWNPGGPAAAVSGLIFGTNAFATIQEAVTAAPAGSVLIVGDGTFTENIIIDKDLTLRSANGRATTEIIGTSEIGSLGTVVVTNTTNGVRIGGAGQGFTIVGIDNGDPGIENAAVYFQGNHNRPEVLGNEIVANGDIGLLTEYGTTITGAVIDGNIFSGQTFVGPEPGVGDQFTVPNVARQLVVMGSGGGAAAAGAGLASNITFSNNHIIGITGGFTAGVEQGNTLVTLDVGDSTITGNTFEGTATRFGSALRVRRPNTTISGNTFITTDMTASTSSLFVQNNTTPLQDIVALNTFDRGAFLHNGTTVWQVIQAPLLAAANTGSTVGVLGGTYTENVVVNNLAGTMTAVTIDAPNGEVLIAPAVGDAITIPNGVTATFTGSYTVTQPVNVDAGSTLAGTATFTGTVNVAAGGTLSPGLTGGTATGVLTVIGTLNLAPGATLDAQVNTTTPGTGHDRVNVQGTVILDGAILDVNGTLASSSGPEVILIANDGLDVVQGRFASLIEGALVTLNGVQFQISYAGGTGNDVTLARVWVNLEIANPVGTSDYFTGEAQLDYVRDLYAKLLGRHASDSEAAGWVALLNQGFTEAEVAAGIFNSTEQRTRQVAHLYQHLLGREASPEEVQGWVNALLQGTTEQEVILAFLTSTEFQGGLDDEAYVDALYEKLFRRAADPAGKAAWVQELTNGVSREQVALSFLRSAEIGGLFVNSYYINYLDRAPDTDGFDIWVDEFEAGNLTDNDLALAFLASAEFIGKLRV